MSKAFLYCLFVFSLTRGTPYAQGWKHDDYDEPDHSRTQCVDPRIDNILAGQKKLNKFGTYLLQRLSQGHENILKRTIQMDVAFNKKLDLILRSRAIAIKDSPIKCDMTSRTKHSVYVDGKHIQGRRNNKWNLKDTINVRAGAKVLAVKSTGHVLYVKKKIVCEGKRIAISCGHGRKIRVTSAIYGRTKTDALVCPYGRHHKNNMRCRRDVKLKVGRSCNNKRSCTLASSNGHYGDPCYGTYKYLEVTYTCGRNARSGFMSSCRKGGLPLPQYSTGAAGHWRCSTRYIRGWQLPNFNDKSWTTPRAYGRNSGRIHVAGIDTGAQWVWLGKYSGNIRRSHLYCRLRLH